MCCDPKDAAAEGSEELCSALEEVALDAMVDVKRGVLTE